MDHVKVEHVVAGSGLSRIYYFIRHRRRSLVGTAVPEPHASAEVASRKRKAGKECPTEAVGSGGVGLASPEGPTDAESAAAEVEAEVRSASDPSAIVATYGMPACTEGAPLDPDCAAALDMFIDALGAEAANLALRFQAHGGVYVAVCALAGMCICTISLSAYTAINWSNNKSIFSAHTATSSVASTAPRFACLSSLPLIRIVPARMPH